MQKERPREKWPRVLWGQEYQPFLLCCVMLNRLTGTPCSLNNVREMHKEVNCTSKFFLHLLGILSMALGVYYLLNNVMYATCMYVGCIKYLLTESQVLMENFQFDTLQ